MKTKLLTKAPGKICLGKIFAKFLTNMQKTLKCLCPGPPPASRSVCMTRLHPNRKFGGHVIRFGTWLKFRQRKSLLMEFAPCHTPWINCDRKLLGVVDGSLLDEGSAKAKNDAEHSSEGFGGIRWNLTAFFRDDG